MSIVEELRTKCDWCEPCDQCVVLMEKAAAEIERLQAIVSRLPTDAEGNPIVQGEARYTMDGRWVRCESVGREFVTDSTGSYYRPHDLFVSREAAEKARTAC